MEHYHDRGLLGWLDSGMAPPHPPIVLDKQIGPKQWDIWKLAANTEEFRTWTGHFTETNSSHRNYFFHYNQSYFIQAVSPFLLLQLYLLFTIAFIQKLLKLNKLSQDPFYKYNK